MTHYNSLFLQVDLVFKINAILNHNGFYRFFNSILYIYFQIYQKIFNYYEKNYELNKIK